MSEPGQLHVEDLRRAFFEDLAITTEHARTTAKEALDGGDLVWPERPEAFEQLRSKLTTKEEIEAFASAVSEIVHVAVHSVLVTIDGGSASAEIGRVLLVDESGSPLGDGLHELFVDHLFDTGRMT